MSDRHARLDEADFSGALAAWRIEFAGREDSLEATWELAAIEERWGDALFFAGEAGALPHYQAAQRALVPQGAVFSSASESERRMEAYGRLTNKLYGIGPDGAPRPSHDGKPHPLSKPVVARKALKPSKAARREAVLGKRKARTTGETELGRIFQGGGHWREHELGDRWFEAAKALAVKHPSEAGRACEWSLYHFEHYNKDWSAHLPASRWDSDGSGEMSEVHDFRSSLGASVPDSPPPDWVSRFLDGDWRGALAAYPEVEPPPEFRPLAVLLGDACRIGGRPDTTHMRK